MFKTSFSQHSLQRPSNQLCLSNNNKPNLGQSSHRGSQRAMTALHAARLQHNFEVNDVNSRTAKRSNSLPPRSTMDDLEDLVVPTRSNRENVLNFSPVRSASFYRSVHAVGNQNRPLASITNSSAIQLSSHPLHASSSNDARVRSDVKSSHNRGVVNNHISENLVPQIKRIITDPVIPSISNSNQISTWSSQHEIFKSTCEQAYRSGEFREIVVPVNDGQEDILSSMCFTLAEGRVCSLTATNDGAYCIAAFSTGVIRLFDLTSNSNKDPEDRYGFVIGKIDSTVQQGSLILHLEVSMYF